MLLDVILCSQSILQGSRLQLYEMFAYITTAEVMYAIAYNCVHCVINIM